jgi:hypothetical protein
VFTSLLFETHVCTSSKTSTEETKPIEGPVYMHPSISTKNFCWGDYSEAHLRSFEALGITLDQFEWWRNLFVGNPFDYTIDSGNGHRDQYNGALSTSTLIRHLQGDIVVGTRSRRSPETGHFVSPWLCLDLDAGPDLITRYDQVCRLFPVLPEVIQSSSSGGLHCYAFFAEEMEVFDLLNPYDGSGLVPRILASHKLQLVSGQIECYPQAIGKEIHGNALRLPFGKDSYLMWPDDLIPEVSTSIGSLKALYCRFALGQVETVTPTALRGCVGVVSRSKKKKPLKRRNSNVSRLRATALESIDRDGLTAPGQLHRALYQKSLHYAIWNWSEEEASVSILKWLDEKNNGYSTTYNESPKLAVKEALSTLTSVMRRFEHRTAWAPMPELTRRETARLLTATPSTLALTDECGVHHSPAKYERFVVNVIRGMKQWVMTQSLREAQFVAASNPEIALGSPEFCKLFADAVQEWWPAITVPIFIVPCPYDFRRSIPGISEATLNFYWRLVGQSKLFTVARHASAFRNLSEAFAVELDFDEQTKSFGDALLQLLPPSAIRDRYSDYHARQLIKEGRQAVHDQPSLTTELDVNEFIRRRLAGLCTACARTDKQSRGNTARSPRSLLRIVAFSDAATGVHRRANRDGNEIPPI